MRKESWKTYDPIWLRDDALDHLVDAIVIYFQIAAPTRAPPRMTIHDRRQIVLVLAVLMNPALHAKCVRVSVQPLQYVADEQTSRQKVPDSLNYNRDITLIRVAVVEK